MSDPQPDPRSIAERSARYAAYVAARTEADRRGLPMPDARTIHAALDAYRDVLRRGAEEVQGDAA